jgi:O-antigen ligase
MVGVLVPLWAKLRKDFVRGLAYAVFCCVSLTTFVRIETGGTLPELTIHRAILISLFIAWCARPELRARFSELPFRRTFLFWTIVNFISLLLTSIAFTDSLKRYLDFVLEAGLFYLIVGTSLRTRDDAIRIMRAAVLGLAVVAFFAIVEHYTRFNPVDRFIPGYVRDEVTGRDVLSTYQHRILLGTGMAVGWPICFALLMSQWQGFPGRKALWTIAAMLLSACFFSQSRGPWLACAIATAVLGLFGSGAIRARLVVVALLAGLTFIIKPGVLESLTTAAESTADVDSFKGGTFRYRLELWRVAWTQVSKEPKRLLFGYGPGSGRQTDLDWTLSYRGKDTKIESWDNQFAYDLFRSGILGSAASILLFIGVWFRLLRLAREAGDADRPLLVCVLASASAMIFMMSNVLIFAKQLDYLFWAVVAAGFTLAAEPIPCQVTDAIEPSHDKMGSRPVQSPRGMSLDSASELGR